MGSHCLNYYKMDAQPNIIVPSNIIKLTLAVSDFILLKFVFKANIIYNMKRAYITCHSDFLLLYTKIARYIMNLC